VSKQNQGCNISTDLRTRDILYVRQASQSSFNSMKTDINLNYEGWNFNSGNYLFTTDTK